MYETRKSVFPLSAGVIFRATSAIWMIKRNPASEITTRLRCFAGNVMLDRARDYVRMTGVCSGHSRICENSWRSLRTKGITAMSGGGDADELVA